MKNAIRQFSRKAHLWLALAILLPSLIVFGSGILLQIKKQSDWIQPPSRSGEARVPSIAFAQVVDIARSIPQLEVANWKHIKRLDVRPKKGIIKIVASNHWEAQIDASTGEILQVAYRRSDTIEAIHDGSWFADFAKLWVFLPAAIILFLMWCSGCVLLYTTLKSKYRKQSMRMQRIHGD